jgi:hypothetical protein
MLLAGPSTSTLGAVSAHIPSSVLLAQCSACSNATLCKPPRVRTAAKKKRADLEQGLWRAGAMLPNMTSSKSPRARYGQLCISSFPPPFLKPGKRKISKAVGDHETTKLETDSEDEPPPAQATEEPRPQVESDSSPPVVTIVDAIIPAKSATQFIPTAPPAAPTAPAPALGVEEEEEEEEGEEGEEETLRQLEGVHSEAVAQPGEIKSTKTEGAPSELVLEGSSSPKPRKSKTWIGRLSNIFPSLTHLNTDSLRQPSVIRRKPVGGSNNNSPTENTPSIPSGLVPPSPPPPLPNKLRKSTAPVELSQSGQSSVGLGLVAAGPADQVAPSPPFMQPFHQNIPTPPIAAPPPIPKAQLLSAQTLHTDMSVPRPPNLNTQLPPMGPPPIPNRSRERSPGIPLTVDTTAQPSPRHSRLQKMNNETQRRSSSQHASRAVSSQLEPDSGRSSPEPRVRSSSAQPPVNRNADRGSRVISNPSVARPQSHHSTRSQSPAGGERERGRLRRSWLPGGRSRSTSQDVSGGQPSNAAAWMLTAEGGDYKIHLLTNSEKVLAL